jgi:hypothetical protein
MRKGYWVVLASQAELAAGIVVASVKPPPIPGLSIDEIFLGTALAYIPTALAGGVIVAQEKGCHFLVGFFLGLFSIPGLILLALIPPYRPPTAHDEGRDDQFLKPSPEGSRSR